MPEPSGWNEREVGRVVSVSNFRVRVLLNPEVRSQVRAYPEHIAMVTQIGGYVLFPVAPGESCVGIVVGAAEDESIEPEGDRGMTLHLAKARRTLTINLLGQLVEGEPFVPGISLYPRLDAPALLPTEKELGDILEFRPTGSRKDKDVPLELGVSPIYARRPVTGSYNDILARPFGIIGNTGSGKSYSVASVVQKALGMRDSAAKQAKIVILDINGEYANAFRAREAPPAKRERELNSVYLNGAPFLLPLWLFNLNEMVAFFEAAQASQVPVLERVIASIREDAMDEGARRGLREIVRACDSCLAYLDTLSGHANKPTEAYGGKKVKDILEHIEATIAKIDAQEDLKPLPESIGECGRNSGGIKAAGIGDHNIPPAAVGLIQAFVQIYTNDLQKVRQEAITKGGLLPITADSPVRFDPLELLRDFYFYDATSRYRGQERIQEYLATLRLRIHRQLSDKRWSVFTQSSEVTLTGMLEAIFGGDDRPVIVVDCSMLSHDVLPFFCAVFGRLVLELRAHAKPDDRTVQPFVLVLEEAHNYLKPRREDESVGLRLSREAFERIAKEGRKFGLSLVIASQRPSDVSATVLSQCANFVVHRIQNPEDIDYFKKILPTGSRDLLDQLPILAPGDGLLLGSAVNVPARIKIHKPNPPPSSDTPRPWEAWQAGMKKFSLSEAASSWCRDTGGETEVPEEPEGEGPPGAE